MLFSSMLVGAFLRRSAFYKNGTVLADSPYDLRMASLLNRRKGMLSEA